MKSGMMNQGSGRETTPDTITHTMSNLTGRKMAETWSTPRGPEIEKIDHLYLRDATLTSDHRAIINSTIAGIEGSGGPISMIWE